MKKYKTLFVIAFALFIIMPFKVSAMEVFIKKIDAETIRLEVESSDTIEAVKGKIYQLDNTFLPENLKLFFGGTEMENGRTLADYNIQQGITIDLVLPLNSEKFEVTFDANGGTFKDGNTFTIDKWENGLETSLKQPTREGYTFKGYYTEKIGGTKLELILAESGIDSDMSFYAQWELEEEVPKTLDNITRSMIMGTISFIGLIGATIYLKRKNKQST